MLIGIVRDMETTLKAQRSCWRSAAAMMFLLFVVCLLILLSVAALYRMGIAWVCLLENHEDDASKAKADHTD